MHGNQEAAKHVADAAAGATALATFMGWLPSVAALFSIVWLAIQISDWSTKSDSAFARGLRWVTRRKKA